MLRMINLILGILMVLPMLIWLAFQGWVAWQSTELMRIFGGWNEITLADAERQNPTPQVEVTLGAQGVAPAAPGLTAPPGAGQRVTLNVLNAAGDSRMKDRIDQHLNPDARSNARDMRVNLQLDIRSLLAPGEAPPPEALRKVFIDARAARLAEAECAQLMAQIAATCVPKSYEARDTPERDSDGMLWGVRMALDYTPRTPTGTPPQAAAQMFTESRLEFAAPNSVDGMDAQALAAWKAEHYALIEAACADIRAIHGNCSVFDMSAGGSRGNAILSARIAWLEAAPVPPAP
jgi:hypothetical protein